MPLCASFDRPQKDSGIRFLGYDKFTPLDILLAHGTTPGPWLISRIQSPSNEVMTRLQAAMFDVGMFAITDPESAQKRLAAADPFGGSLQAYSRCVQDGHLTAHVHEVELGDQTLRATLATSTNRSVAQPYAAEVRDSCPEFARAAGAVRASVDRTGRAYAEVLDRLVHGSAAVDTERADSFVDAVRR